MRKDDIYTSPCSIMLFFFNDTATTEIYTLSLHDALPIYDLLARDEQRRHLGAEILRGGGVELEDGTVAEIDHRITVGDRKSTRLNSSHANISYAVFCLKKKKTFMHSICHNLILFTSLSLF